MIWAIFAAIRSGTTVRRTGEDGGAEVSGRWQQSMLWLPRLAWVM